MHRLKLSGVCSALLLASLAQAHDERRTADIWQGYDASETWLDTLVAAVLNPAHAAARIFIEGQYRVIESDNTPTHATGQFPNPDNPNRIKKYDKTFRVPAKPEYTDRAYTLGLWPFGVAVNGVVFDPGAAEFWQNNPQSGWQYEALGGGVSLGLDRNNAHVQPNGTYHYHGLPTGLMARFAEIKAPALLGYAADGFPIYGPLGFADPVDADSKLISLHSSYTLKSGLRNGGPGGRHDGSFVQDYAFKAGAGDLDDCNGRFGITAEYPDGSYYYVITEQFPFIPRCFHGTPDRSFMRGPAAAGGPARFEKGPRDMQQPPQGASGRGGPPQEAIAACTGKSDGDSVSFTTPYGDTISAVCRQQHGMLFAIPRHHPPGR